MLNKPKGVLCTNNDPDGRKRVIDLFPREKVRLFPVGRLDEESEGLLIVTNDGDLAHQLAHPRYRIYRTYRIQVAGHPTSEQLQKLRDGIFFKEGKFRVISVRVAGKKGKSTFLEVVLGEGHNREVRRLFARIGHKVMSLERLAFGPLKIAKLKRGAYREITKDEMTQLREILTRNRSTPSKEAGDREKKHYRPSSDKKTVKKSFTRSSRGLQEKKRTPVSNKRKPKTYVFK
ncbi:MAG: rRNA pseudouridine synthase [Planctomycetaceae bacterium]|nr:rRNA pseudouridine synthase [Planctomycetaceae bacterium]